MTVFYDSTRDLTLIATPFGTQVLVEREPQAKAQRDGRVPRLGSVGEPSRSTSTCTDCGHPGGFHKNGICSMAACYCKRSFDEKPEPSVSRQENAPDSNRKGA